jgi:gliding motility-associated-like protein
LTASPGFDAYTWSNGVTGSTQQTGAGTYSVTGEFQGCVRTSAPFTLTEVDPGPPVITGATQYCEGENVTLTTTGTPYTSLQWSSGQTATSIIATAGTYTVSASYLNCDYVSEPFVVEEVILPEVIITGDATYCAGSLAFLNATPGFDTYTWNNGSTGANISVQAGTYFVTATIGPCSTSSLTFTVTEAPNPTPVITGPTVGCSGQPLVLSTTEQYTSYAWSNGSNASTAAVLTGTYTVTVTNQFGCSGTSAPFSVVVDEDPIADFTADPPSPQLPNTTVVFQDASDPNGGTIVSWQWDLGTPGATANTQNTSWTYTEPGEYPVVLVVRTANGCVDTATVVYIIRPAEIIIPNVFSPNGDGVNDTFSIVNIEYFQNDVTIFNRWGQSLYEAKDYRNQWKGEDVPDGTYFYVVRLGDGREYTGHVTILR